MQTKQAPTHLGKATALAIGATMCMAFAAVVVKLGDGLELTTASMIFWRNFISLCIILPWILWSSSVPKIEQTLHTKGWRLHWIRGGASFASVFLYFWSLQFLSLSSATALFNTIPIFVPIVVYLWLKIPIHHNLWWALGTAFCGILLVVQPGVGIFHWASLVALGAGIFGAIASVALRIGHYSETPKTLMAYLFGICLLLSIPCTLFSFDQSFGNFSWEQFKIYLPLGIFGFGFQFLWTFAARFAPMRLLSPFLYLAVIFGMIFDRTIWNIAINGLQLLGFCLIVIGIILMIFLYPKQTQKR